MNRKIFCKLGRWCCVLVKQVVRVTLTRPSWHRSDMVQWLVSCATELGYEALISLMKSWYTLFTAAEATSQSQFSVSFCIVSSYAVTVLNRCMRHDFIRSVICFIVSNFVYFSF